MESIDGPAPAGPVLSREVLETLRQQAGERARWMEAARTARDAASAEHAQALRDIEAQRNAWQEAARAQAKQDAQTLAEAARQAAVVQAVEWLVDEASMEREIMRSLERRIADALTVALSNFVDKLDIGERFAHRVCRTLPSLVRDGALVLRVPPMQQRAIADALREADIVLACSADATLAGRQARLESEWVTVCLDLDADLAAVIDRLRVGPSLEVAYG
uniref:Type III secretion system protein n=2 Tax=Pandoraea faecigallinarum TaxID=656179 RepID=A0A0H3WSS6_9BURK